MTLPRPTSPDSQQRPDASSAALDLLDLARVAWRRKSLLIAVLVASLGAGVVYLSVATPQYMTKTRLLVERHDVTPDKRAQQRFEPAFVATQAEIVRSRAVVQRALNDFLPPRIASLADPVDKVLDAIRVSPVEGTNVMQVSFRWPDKAEAERMLAAVVASYADYLRDSEHDTQLQTLTFLTASEKEIREQLEKKQEEYRKFGNGSSLPGVGHDAGKVHTDYLTNLGKALTDVKSRRLQLENQSLAWTKLAARNQQQAPHPEVGGFFPTSLVTRPPAGDADPDGGILALPDAQQLGHVLEIRAVEKELHEALQWEKELDARYGDQHPDLRAARAKITALKARQQDMLDAIPRILANELDIARKDEQELQQLYESEKQLAKQLDVQLLEDSQRLATIERLKAVHDSILADLHTRQLASVSAAGGHGVVHVSTITAPTSTGSPVWPIPALVFAICGGLGLAAGLGLALAVERRAAQRATRAPRPGASPPAAAGDPRAADAAHENE